MMWNVQWLGQARRAVARRREVGDLAALLGDLAALLGDLAALLGDLAALLGDLRGAVRVCGLDFCGPEPDEAALRPSKRWFSW
jgi:hypothetical protein